MLKQRRGFTLVELLLVMAITGILATASLFSLNNSRRTARDTRRKADLETIGQGLAFYKSDCYVYKAGSGSVTSALGAALVGDNSTATCLPTNTYIDRVPNDPISGRYYRYYSTSPGQTFELCAALEDIPTGTSVTCGGSSVCGTGITCNYRITNP